MKKLLALILSATLLLSTGCGKTESVEFSWSEVSSAVTVEVGSDYVFESPSVKANGENLSVKTKVTKDGGVIANNGNKFYVDETGTYLVTYYAEKNGKKSSVETKITAVDTSAPTASFNLPSVLRFNTNLKLSNVLEIKDNYVSELKNAKIDYSLFDITDGTENVLREEYDSTENVIRVENDAIRKIRIKATVTDSSGNFDTTTHDIDMIDIDNYGRYGFDNFTSVEQLSNVTAVGNDANVELIEENGFKVVKTTSTGTYPKFILKDEIIKDISRMDFIRVKLKVVNSTSSCVFGMKGTSGDVYNYPEGLSGNISSLPTRDGWMIATWRKNTEKGKAIFDYLAKNGSMEIVAYAFGGAQTITSFTVAEIVGGYCENVYVGKESGINLSNVFSLNSNEFDASFKKTDEDNYSALSESEKVGFKSSVGGSLKVTVKKDGYKTTEYDNIPVIIDEQGPEISCGLSVIGYNIDYALGEVINVSDVSGIRNKTIEVFDLTDGSQKVLAQGFDEKTGILNVSDSKIKKIAVKVSASDIFGNSSENYFEFSLILKEYGRLSAPFNYISVIKGTQATVSFVEEDGYGAIKAEATAVGQNMHVRIEDESIKDLAKFDYITVRLKISYSGGNGIIGLKGTSGDVYNVPQGMTNSLSQLVSDGEWKIVTWNKNRVNASGTPTGQYVFDYIKTNGAIEFATLCYTANVVQSLTIAEIYGGYEDISLSEDAIDLTEKLGFNEEEIKAKFIDESGNGTAVSDMTNFVPNNAGTLRITVKKQGYAPTEIIINVK